MLSIIYAEYHNAECHYDECHYAECRYAVVICAECHISIFMLRVTFKPFIQNVIMLIVILLNVIILNVIMLNVIMLNVAW